MLRIILIRPGCTDYDEQGRIAGTLDMPLCHQGAGQVAHLVEELADLSISVVYAAPCQASQQTAQALADAKDIKLRRLDKLQNLNMGLWQGRLIDEVKQRQKKIYKQWQEHPETVCPPEGETLGGAALRIGPALDRIIKRHKDGIIALVVPQPLCNLVRSRLTDTDVGDLWAAESDCGSWELIEVGQKEKVTR